MKRIKFPWYKLLLFLIDIIIINFSFMLSIRLKFAPNIDIINFNRNNFYLIPEAIFFILFSLFIIFFFHLSSLYKIQIILNPFKQLKRLIRVLIYSLAIYTTLYFFIRLDRWIFFSRFVVISWFLISSSLFLIFRVLLYPYLHKFLIKTGITKRNLLIIGDKNITELIIKRLSNNSEYGFKVTGYFLFNNNINFKNSPVEYYGLFSYDEVKRIVKKKHISHIIIATDILETSKAVEIITTLSDIVPFIEITSSYYQRLSKLLDIEWYLDIPVFPLGVSPFYFWYKFFKRFADISSSIIFLILFSPFLLIIALIIKFSSKGPVIITQDRIGKYGKRFKFLKFRTMKLVSKKKDIKRHEKYKNHIKNENIVFQKIIDHSRVTLIGKFLRKTAIDEIPQLINVIKGEMSVVGPRPCIPQEYASYDSWHKKRYNIIPGCTGIWQVIKHKGTSFSDTILLDLYYIHNVSPWLDFQLILQTFEIILKGQADK